MSEIEFWTFFNNPLNELNTNYNVRELINLNELPIYFIVYFINFVGVSCLYMVKHTYMFGYMVVRSICI